MRKMLTIALLLSSTPAWACHHYSVWNYPWKQTCRDNKMEARFVPAREIPKTPLQQVIEDKSSPQLYAMEDINHLNLLFQLNSAYKNSIPDIPVDAIFQLGPNNIKPIEDMEQNIGEDEIQRMNAIEKLKQQQ